MQHPTRHAVNARQRAARAFTLIELLLVLVILAVLAAIVVPRFSGQSERARIAATTTALANIENAIERFEIDNGRYPRSDEGLLALFEEPADTVNESWHGPYLRRNEIPTDDWGNEYIYEYPGRFNLNGYDLHSMGPDGQSGTEDDIKNWSEERL